MDNQLDLKQQIQERTKDVLNAEQKGNLKQKVQVRAKDDQNAEQKGHLMKLQQSAKQKERIPDKGQLTQVQRQNIQKNKKINKNRKRKQEQIVYKNLTAFKEQQKHYKLYQDRQTDFLPLFNPEDAQKLHIDGYTVYKLPAPQEGSYLIKGFNKPGVVNQIGCLGLNEFWKKPYRTNLNSRTQLYEQRQQENKQLQVQQHDFLQDATQEQFQRQLKEKGYNFNDKIRWANVGHQYDWTLRKYPEYHTPMHQKIKELTDKANLVFNKITNQNKEYHPESAIVNYYGVKDYMTGHLDDAQYDQVSPIYSFSFGLSCVFLMGGMTKDQKPLAVRLNSGDLLVMSKNSRKCYHGVPRVISQSYQEKFVENPDIQKINQNLNHPRDVQKYFTTHRININIRQVFAQGEK